MIQDPDNRYIAAILSRCDLQDKDLLELGCGKGRITRDLARHARRVLACDPDADALATARAKVTAENVQFLLTPQGVPELPAASFDLALYTLSLHHVLPSRMSRSLAAVARLLRPGGAIAVLEPGAGGSFMEAKARFGAGSGDEGPLQAAALAAMHAFAGWRVGETLHFRTNWHFDDEEDFLTNMLPGHRQQPPAFLEEVRSFLARFRYPEGILLDADRRLNLLHREDAR